MKVNKKLAAGMLSLGLVAGTAGAVAISAHAQQNALPQPQTPQAASPQQNTQGTTAGTDTNNVQNPAGPGEQPDTLTGHAEQPGTEAADTPDNGPNSGHRDRGNTDHQFEGQE